MVKLRVAARIFAEDDYLKSLQGSANSPLNGEKRLVVVVRDPYKWQIGTLALEVQRAYQSCYQLELPTIKYLKDNEDDCDLDPRAYVSDLLLDEGKAQIDASDQRVTIKVILEQGRALREGSVAIGSQLDDPRYQSQLEKSSRPPVPTFPPQPSSLGKRPFPIDDDYASTAGVSKRPRQVEIPETQREDQIPISSIEHEDVQGSLELVEGTQFTNPDQDLGGQQTLLQPKQESPELRRLLQNVAPATLDELEELAERPTTFGFNKRQRNGSAYHHDTHEVHQPNGVSPSLDALGRLQKRSQGPITPPSETSRRLSTSASHQVRPAEEATKSTAQPASGSASKFKRRDIYDYPESDIDDSQMSPRSRQAQLSSRRSKDRLLYIERLQSPRDYEEGDNGLSISQAIDVLDDESVFEENRSIIQSLPAPELTTSKTNTGSADEIDNSIYEDAETGDPQRSGLADTDTPEEAEGNGIANPEQVNEDDKENGPPVAISTTPRKIATKDTVAEDAASGIPSDLHSAKSTGLSQEERARESQPMAKRVRKRKSNSLSVDGSQQGLVQESDRSIRAYAQKQAKNAPNPSRKPKESQKTSNLDSPGEQLSQSLRESTGSQLPIEAVAKRLAGTQQKTGLTTPAKKNKPHKPEKDSEGPGSMLSRSTTSKKDTTSTTPSERARAKKSLEKPSVATAGLEMVAAGSSPTVILPATQQDHGMANVITKPLPNWGSGPTAAEKRSSSVTVVVGGVRDEKQADSAKNSSSGLGLTPEEIKIMESRKGMTKEQYEAEKKRKQLEAKRNAEGQKKQGATVKKKGTTEKSSADQGTAAHSSKTPEPKPTVPLTKKTPKSLSVEDDDDGSAPADKTTRPDTAKDTEEPKQGTKLSSPGIANSAKRRSSSTSFPKVQIAEPKWPPKTPAKAPTKSPSVKSSTVNKTPKPSVRAHPTEDNATSSAPARKSTPAPIAKTESKVGKTPAKTPQPRKPTLQTAKSLVDLHQLVRNANRAGKTATESVLSRVNAAKQKQTPSTFNVDDDDDDEEESDDSEEDVPEEVKAVPPTRKTPQVGNQKEKKNNTGDKDDEEEESDDSSTSSPSSERVGKKVGEKRTIANRTSQTKRKPFDLPGASKWGDGPVSDDSGDDTSTSYSDEDTSEEEEL